MRTPAKAPTKVRGKMQENHAKWLINAFRIIFIGLLAVAMGYCIINRDRLTIDNIVGIAPDDLFIAAIFFILIYGAKSLTVFFPVTILQIAVGIIFSPFWGIVINILGAFSQVSVPYLFARYTGMGSDLVEKLMHKYPFLKDFADKHTKNEFFLSFFLRIMGFLPLDIISMLLGVINVSYWKFAVGSVLGMMPGIFASTIMGASIMNPFSPQFIISFAITGGISVGSLVLYLIKSKKGSKEKEA